MTGPTRTSRRRFTRLTVCPSVKLSSLRLPEGTGCVCHRCDGSGDAYRSRMWRGDRIQISPRRSGLVASLRSAIPGCDPSVSNRSFDCCRSRICSRTMRGTGFEPREDVLATLRATSLLRIRIGDASPREIARRSMRGTGFEPRGLRFARPLGRESAPAPSLVFSLRSKTRSVRGTGFEPADPYGTAS